MAPSVCLLPWRSRITALLAFASLCIPSISHAAELTQKDLAALLQKAVKDRKFEIEPPTLRVRDGVLYYLLRGGINRGSFEERSPLMFPTDMQALVMALREYARKEKIEDLWKPHLAKIEEVVQQELSAIAKLRGKRMELLEILAERDEVAFKAFEAGLRATAKHKKLGYGGAISEGRKEWSVTFKTIPDTGAVYYLNEGDYDIHTEGVKLDIVEKQIPWITAEGSLQMGKGYYWVFAKWPKGETSEKKRLFIDKEATYTFRPK
jgi:hypothetical protein